MIENWKGHGPMPGSLEKVSEAKQPFATFAAKAQVRDRHSFV